jgi:hypothetical protein
MTKDTKHISFMQFITLSYANITGTALQFIFKTIFCDKTN